MTTCTGVTKRGLPCSRVVASPHARCKAHRTSTETPSTRGSARVQPHPSAPPSDPSPSRGLYDELLRYQMANPHHALFEDPLDGDAATNLEPNDDSERIQEARLLRQQQDEDFARSLRKDRAVERWKRCRVVVYALIELRRWMRSHLCVSVIRAIQRCDAQCREMCFSTRVSQGQRNAIGAVVQQNKHIERWCRMWLERRSHGDWEVNRLVSVQLTPTRHVVDAS